MIRIDFSKLTDSEYMDKLWKQMINTRDTDNVFVNNDQNATPKQVFDAYIKAFAWDDKSLFNSELGKEWQKHPENSDNDADFKMPSLEFAEGGLYFADENNYYFNNDGKNFPVKNIAQERYKQADGKIEDFRQGNVGTCWNNAGIKGVSNYNNQEEIKKCLKKNPDGSWKVTFRGVEGKPQFTVTQEEFSATENNHLSSGDPDMKILEIATKKLFLSDLLEETRKVDKSNPLDGGRLEEMYKYLLDKDEFKTYTFLSEKRYKPYNEIYNDLDETYSEYKEWCAKQKGLCAASDLDKLDKEYSSLAEERYKKMSSDKLSKVLDILNKLKIKLPVIAATSKKDGVSFSGEIRTPDIKKGHAYTIDEVLQYRVLLNDPNKGKQILHRQEFLDSMSEFSIALPTNTDNPVKNYAKDLSKFDWKKSDIVNIYNFYKDFDKLQDLKKTLDSE